MKLLRVLSDSVLFRFLGDKGFFRLFSDRVFFRFLSCRVPIRVVSGRVLFEPSEIGFYSMSSVIDSSLGSVVLLFEHAAIRLLVS